MMNKSETYIISGNYFIIKYVEMLSSFAKSIESNCFIEYDNKSVSLKSAIELSELSEITPGRKLKLLCFNDNSKKALDDLKKIRRLIEYDYTTAIESN